MYYHEKVNEHYLMSVLEQILDSFPIAILRLHSNNGCEYTNQRVGKLLSKNIDHIY